jgi:hypothetical protein
MALESPLPTFRTVRVVEFAANVKSQFDWATGDASSQY